MTKKNAGKIEARARKEALGGKYQHHLRQAGGGAGIGSCGEGSEPPAPPYPWSIRCQSEVDCPLTYWNGQSGEPSPDCECLHIDTSLPLLDGDDYGD